MLRTSVVVMIVTLPGLVGCENREAPTGKVSFPDGTPLTLGQVVFECAELKCGGAAQIQEDGTFQVYRPLLSGEYVVYITGSDELPNGRTGKPRIRDEFTESDRSPLRVTIGNSEFCTLTVEAP